VEILEPETPRLIGGETETITEEEVTTEISEEEATPTNTNQEDEAVAEQETEETEEMIGLEIEVPAASEVIVPFKLTVPENTEVGDHTGGLIIEGAPTKAVGTGFNVRTRIGARIYLTVPGEKIVDLELKDFSWRIVDYTLEELERLFLGKLQGFFGLYRKGIFSVKLENPGNVRLGTVDVPLRGKLIIRNVVNQIVDENELDLGTILPKGEITQTFTWNRDNPLFLRYQAILEVSYADDKAPESVMIYFWVIPWPLLLLLAGLIVVILITWLIIKLIRTKRRSRMVKYIFQRGDTPESLAEHFKVSLKKLVKINKIKAENPIQPGQTLTIPLSDLVPDPAAFRLEKINVFVWIANAVLFAVLLVLVALIIFKVTG